MSPAQVQKVSAERERGLSVLFSQHLLRLLYKKEISNGLKLIFKLCFYSRICFQALYEMEKLQEQGSHEVPDCVIITLSNCAGSHVTTVQPFSYPFSPPQKCMGHVGTQQQPQLSTHTLKPLVMQTKGDKDALIGHRNYKIVDL